MIPSVLGGISASDGWRARLRGWLERPQVQNAFIGLILINAAIFGLETSSAVMAQVGPVLVALDRLILLIFVVEIGLRLVAWGPRFFRDAWNVFDFAVVAVALIPATGSLSALRALRVLRVLRLISLVPQFRAVVSALLGAIPGIGAIAAILSLLLYVSAVIATKLFADIAPSLFGNLGQTLFTLFQIMTLEGWAEIARQIMDKNPAAWLFFVPFILITTFTMLNLFIAIIVGAMDRERPQGASAEQVEFLSRQIADLSAAMKAAPRAPPATGN